jgi:hypothetical protein
MKQCQHCGNNLPVSVTGIYCPKCQDLLYEKKKQQDQELIKKGYDPALVDAQFNNTLFHVFGAPIIILLTIPKISSTENWYWIVGIYEAVFFVNLWLGSANIYNKSKEKYSSGLNESERIAFVISNYIFITYIVSIIIYYGYNWFIK